MTVCRDSDCTTTVLSKNLCFIVNTDAWMTRHYGRDDHHLYPTSVSAPTALGYVQTSAAICADLACDCNCHYGCR